jgi:hypothetical protein
MHNAESNLRFATVQDRLASSSSRQVEISLDKVLLEAILAQRGTHGGGTPAVLGRYVGMYVCTVPWEAGGKSIPDTLDRR